MKVIVSTELQDNFANFVLVDSLKRVGELNGVDTLIIHKCKESDFDAGVFISDYAKNGISRFIYICSNQSPTLLMTLKGVNGHCYDDEFYLEDEEELLALVEELESEADDDAQLALALPSLGVLEDFVSGFSKGEERIQAPVYLETVKSAITDLAELTENQQMQLSAMGSSALAMFEKASEIIRNMSERNKKIMEKLSEIENGATAQAKSSFSNSVMFFQPYVYRANSKLLLIREYAPCRYLTSFVLGYLHHLHYELNRRPKLIFVIQKGQGVGVKYDDYPVITQDNMAIGSLYNGEIVATNNPKKEVMKELLSKPNDVFIVVDRLYSNVDIVSGRMTKVSALSSRSDIARYKVKPDDAIFSVTAQPKQLFTIPVIKSFPQEIDARYATYAQVMGDKYAILDAKIGLKAGD